MRFFRNKFFVFTLTVVVLALLAMAFSVRTGNNMSQIEDITGVIITSVQKLSTGLRRNIDAFFSYFTDFDALAEENEDLKNRIAELENKLKLSQIHENENAELKGLLGINDRIADYDKQLAEIIARDVNDWFSGFTIDKGTLDGVRQYDPVVTAQGLVGTVFEVGTNWAKVSTILAPDTSIGTMCTRSRDTGIVEGSFELMLDGRCRMSYISKDADISPADMVETSGLGGIYPKGIDIGRIVEIGLESHGISQYAIIEPKVDFDRLTNVFVIVGYGMEGVR